MIFLNSLLQAELLASIIVMKICFTLHQLLNRTRDGKLSGVYLHSSFTELLYFLLIARLHYDRQFHYDVLMMKTKKTLHEKT